MSRIVCAWQLSAIQLRAEQYRHFHGVEQKSRDGSVRGAGDLHGQPATEAAKAGATKDDESVTNLSQLGM